MNENTMNTMKTMATGAITEALGSAMSNPNINLRAFDSTVHNMQKAVVPGSSAMYHYAWATGLGTVSVSNFMIAWHLPSSRKILRGIAVATGVLSGAAAYLNVQKARTR
jgi:hypothetical protein